MKKTLARSAALRQTLSERQRELQDDIHRRLRNGRTEQRSEGRDEFEQSNDENQGDMDLVLLQMRANTLSRIDKALRRLDAGEYGICTECSREIAAARLRALPFAVRCLACEAEREADQDHARRQGDQPDALSMVMDRAGS
jgi:DnaK suppressor protein